MTDHPFDERDRANITAFVEHILDGHGSGAIETAIAVSALVSTMVALGAGDLHDARAWFEEGRKHAMRATVPHR